MKDAEHDLRVECYAGYRGEQTPRAFGVGDRRVEIAHVLDQWLAPDHRYFKVADAAGDIYILRHDVRSERWELTMYRSEFVIRRLAIGD